MTRWRLAGAAAVALICVGCGEKSVVDPLAWAGMIN
jgi:hypothetical protein